MSERTWDIDAIVREVLERLRQPAPVRPIRRAEPVATAVRHDGLLRLDERVISLATLEGKTRNVRRVLVGRSSIITPSARDLLRRQSIELVRETAAGATPDDFPPCTIRVAAGDFAVDVLSRQLGLSVCQTEGTADALQQATREVLQQKRLGVVITRQAALAICVANRRPGVRAVAGQTEESIREAVRAIGANLVIIDPRGRKADELYAADPHISAERTTRVPD